MIRSARIATVLSWWSSKNLGFFSSSSSAASVCSSDVFGAAPAGACAGNSVVPARTAAKLRLDMLIQTRPPIGRNLPTATLHPILPEHVNHLQNWDERLHS